MNQKQREFLIDKINKSAKNKQDELREKIPKKPDISSYVLGDIMNGSMNIVSNDQLKELIIKKIKTAVKEDETWAKKSNRGYGYHSRHNGEEEYQISFDIKDIFVLTDEFDKDFSAYVKEKESIEQEITAVHAQQETLIIRITLASNSTLETMINEVDDMGNLSLMDTKIKAIAAG